MPTADVAQLDGQLRRASDAYERLVGSMEPCYRCGCCKRWTAALELLRASIPRHLHPAPCPDGCLVCGMGL